MGGSKYMVGWPAGRPDFSKKGLPGSIQPTRPAALFFEKPGRPAGQPTMYLDPPIHFGCIFIGIGILLDVFSVLGGGIFYDYGG